MALERAIIDAPPQFDRNHPMHGPAVLAAFAKAKRPDGKEWGPGWEIDNFDSKNGTLHLVRQGSVVEVVESTKPRKRGRRLKEVGLPRGTKPNDAQKWAENLEDQHKGFYLTRFEPFLGKAILGELSDDELRCRGAVATVMSVKPWEVEVESQPTGGFRIQLPKNYVPSRHYDKLVEVAEQVVGRPGWYVEVDANALIAEFIPSEQPTFPPSFMYPMQHLKNANPHKIPLGLNLAKPGQDPQDGAETILDFTAAHAGLVGGLPRSGKTVTLRSLVAGSLAGGAELVVITTKAKSVDFTWMRDMVRPGGWGCESLREAVAALGLVYEEGQRRAEILAQEGVENWFSLPAGTMKPLLFIVDEFAVMTAKEMIPSGVPKDDPDKIAAVEIQRLKNRLIKYVTENIAEMGFVGIRGVLSSQVTNASTGLPPALKSLLGHKILVGANPSEVQRKQTFNDVSSVPNVPHNVRDDSAAARGSATIESEGCESAIFKSYFAESDDLRTALLKLGVPLTNRPRPTESEIYRLTPTPLDEIDSGPPPSKLDAGGFGEVDGRDKREPALRGAARAAHETKMLGN